MTNLLTKKWEIDNHLQGRSFSTKRIYTLDELHETRRVFKKHGFKSFQVYPKDPITFSDDDWGV